MYLTVRQTLIFNGHIFSYTFHSVASTLIPGQREYLISQRLACEIITLIPEEYTLNSLLSHSNITFQYLQRIFAIVYTCDLTLSTFPHAKF